MSSFLLYFGATILRGALAVLFLLAAEMLLRQRLGPGFRRWLWLTCLILMLIPQVNFSISPFQIDLSSLRISSSSVKKAIQSIAPTSGLPAGEAVFGVTADTIALRTFWHHLRPYRKALPFIALGLLPLPALFLLLRRYSRCRRMIRSLPPVSDYRILNSWKQIIEECGPLSHPVILLDSSCRKLGPTLFGCFTRKLLLPVDALKQLTDGELRLLLEHEYHHSRAGDPFINILALTLWAFAWYNPFMLIARHRLRVCCELECDRKILARHPFAVREYGNLLLLFASPATSPLAIGLAESSHELSHRIRSMTAVVRNRKGRISGKWTAALLAVALASPVCLVAIHVKPASRQHPQTPAAVEKSVLPHLILRPLASEEFLACWEIAYPEEFPYTQSTLFLELGGERLEVELRQKPGFLLLKQNTESIGHDLEAVVVPPFFTDSLDNSDVFGQKTIPAADWKTIDASLPHTGIRVRFSLQVNGIERDELSDYRRPTY